MIIDNPRGQGYYCTRCGILYAHHGNIKEKCFRSECEIKPFREVPGPVKAFRRKNESVTENLI